MIVLGSPKQAKTKKYDVLIAARVCATQWLITIMKKYSLRTTANVISL